VINVKDMGAVGDATKDDTAAIQAALNASLSVYFPAGEYKVKPATGSLGTTALILRTGHHVFGDGYASRP
jgi:hypothetical protein